MTSVTADNTRLLFIVDNDYGELTLAMYFLHGRSIANRTTLLLPPHLWAANKEGLPVRTGQYTTQEHLMRTIDAENPDIVFLFSGYLLPMHKLLSTQELDGIIRHLRNQGYRVATYDPSWELMSIPHMALRTHYLEESQSGAFVKHALYAMARLAFRTLNRSSEILKDVLHVYPAPISTEHVRSVSFFNPSLLGAQAVLNKDVLAQPPTGARIRSAQRPYWLFILASEDYKGQMWKSGGLFYWGGKKRFVDLLVRTLQQTLHAARHPIFIGPRDCTEAVKKQIPPTDDVTLLNFCPYERFMSLLLSAEYVFYWNAMSSSSLIRLINDLPVFYFDRGHIARGLGPVYERTVQWYYQGWQPIYLDQEQELTADVLEQSLPGYRRATDRIRRQLQRSPTPERMIEEILADIP